jgi:hypothetical protein
VSYNYFIEGSLEPKLECYGTSKKIRKTRGLQTTIQVVTLMITTCKTTWKKIKSYILCIKLTIYGAISPKHHINFGLKSNHMTVLERM